MHSLSGDVLFLSRSAGKHFSEPVEIVSAQNLDEVKPCLSRIADGVERGLAAAGFLAYESAPVFDPAHKTHPPGFMPLLWFGLYRDARDFAGGQKRTGGFKVGEWSALVSREQYRENINRIRRLIKDGETYQVNYTFPLRAEFRGDTLAWFHQLCAAQRADHAARIDLGRYHVLSASPELFFRLNGDKLEARPMKGTRPRGRWSEEDSQLAVELTESEKDRAENIMIVDLLRNDMGRISEPGSVHVRDLYTVEQYPTVWQMTSDIISRTSATVPEIMSALFPCGSVTGAPKIRTMEIIRDMEPHPRGIYCGAIGWWLPGRRAEFSVAIRTVTVDTEKGQAFYNVGGGVTTGSTPDGEYRECLDKAAVLKRIEPEYELIESMLFDGRYFLPDEHMRRLQESAAYFGFELDRAAVESAIEKEAEDLLARDKTSAYKVRLLLRRNGSVHIESAPIKVPARVRLGFAAGPVDRQNVFLYHKTTRRSIYDRALASRPDCDDVLLWNEEGEITESAIANVVLELNGELLTPPVGAGLLPGVFRRHLIERGEIRERNLRKEDVLRSDSIRLINSVRKWMETDWIGS